MESTDEEGRVCSKQWEGLVQVSCSLKKLKEGQCSYNKESIGKHGEHESVLQREKMRGGGAGARCKAL